MSSQHELVRAPRAGAAPSHRPLVVVSFAGATLGTRMRVGRAVRRVQAMRRRGFDVAVVVGAPRHALRRIAARFAEIGLGAGDMLTERARASRSAAEVPAALLAAALGMAGVGARSVSSDDAAEIAAAVRARDVVPIIAVGDDCAADTAPHAGVARAAILLSAALGAVACHVVVESAEELAAADGAASGARELLPSGVAVGSIVTPESARHAASAGVELAIHHHCAPVALRAFSSARVLARRIGEAS